MNNTNSNVTIQENFNENTIENKNDEENVVEESEENNKKVATNSINYNKTNVSTDSKINNTENSNNSYGAVLSADGIRYLTKEEREALDKENAELDAKADESIKSLKKPGERTEQQTQSTPEPSTESMPEEETTEVVE